MRRMASPAALSRTLSLQRANARAKSSRAESFSDKQCGNSQLSERIDILFTSISSSNSNATDIHEYTQSKLAASERPASKQLALQQVNVDGTHSNIALMKRSLSADIPSGYKACFSSLSERIDRGIDLWDRDFSSMSSYNASDHDGFLCGLQTRLNGDSNILCEPAKDNARSKISSWSEYISFNADAIQMEDGESSNANYRLQGLIGIDCSSGRPHSYVVTNRNWQRSMCNPSLQASDKHTLRLNPQYSADYTEGAKTARTAGSLEEYLISRGGYVTAQGLQEGDSCPHTRSLQDASALRDGVDDEEAKLSTVNERRSGSIIDGSSKSEGHEEGEVIISSSDNLADSSLYRMRVRSKREYEEEIMSSIKGDDDQEEIGIASSKEREWNLCKDSVAVEMVSVDVVEDFRESMYEMMMMMMMEMEEDTCMQHLLNSYLLLNPSNLHALITEAFSDVWIDIIMTIR